MALLILKATEYIYIYRDRVDIIRVREATHYLLIAFRSLTNFQINVQNDFFFELYFSKILVGEEESHVKVGWWSYSVAKWKAGRNN